MKQSLRLMIVSDKADLEDLFMTYLNGQDALIVNYQHPLKALDNMDEVMPDIIFWDHEDFPRHWKIAATWRNGNPRLQKASLVIVCSHPMGQEESEKVEAFENLLVIEDGFSSEQLKNYLKNQNGHDQTNSSSYQDSNLIISDSTYVSFINNKNDEIVLCHIETKNEHFLVARPIGLTSSYDDFLGQIFSNVRISTNEGVAQVSLKCVGIDDDYRLKMLLV